MLVGAPGSAESPAVPTCAEPGRPRWSRALGTLRRHRARARLRLVGTQPGWHQAGGWHCQGCGSPWRLSLLGGAMGPGPAPARRLCHHPWAGVRPHPSSWPPPFWAFPSSGPLRPRGSGEAGSGCCVGGCAPPHGGVRALGPQSWAGASGHAPGRAGGTAAAFLPPGAGTHGWEMWGPIARGCPGGGARPVPLRRVRAGPRPPAALGPARAHPGQRRPAGCSESAGSPRPVLSSKSPRLGGGQPGPEPPRLDSAAGPVINAPASAAAARNPHPV